VEDESYCVEQHSLRVIGMNLDDILAMNRLAPHVYARIERTLGVNHSELTLIPRFREAIQSG
jgi:hypothetical protein